MSDVIERGGELTGDEQRRTQAARSLDRLFLHSKREMLVKACVRGCPAVSYALGNGRWVGLRAPARGVTGKSVNDESGRVR